MIGAGPEEELDLHSTDVATMPAAGISRIVVSSAVAGIHSLSEGSGPYQLLVRKVHRAPESIGAALPINDTVTGERIDRVEDIDEFTANLTAGEGYRVFVQAVDGPPGGAVVVLVPSLGRRVESPRVQSATPLAAHSTDTFTPATSGPVLIQVYGVGVPSPARLQTIRVSRQRAAGNGAEYDRLGRFRHHGTHRHAGDIDSFTVDGESQRAL